MEVGAAGAAKPAIVAFGAKPDASDPPTRPPNVEIAVLCLLLKSALSEKPTECF